MKLPTPRRRRPTFLHLTPMIDVVFNLIIFFLVASHFARPESLVAVELPGATEAVAQPDLPRRLIITIDQEGRWTIGGKLQTLAELEEQIREAAGEHPESFAVHLRGDRRTPVRFIEPLLLACTRAGVTHIQTHVRPR